MYLDSTRSMAVQEGRHICAQFALAISNPHHPTIHTVSRTWFKVQDMPAKSLTTPLLDAHHRFTAEEPDWGFTHFGYLDRLTQSQPDHNCPTIENGSAVVSVYVRVLEDPTGLLWYDFVK